MKYKPIRKITLKRIPTLFSCDRSVIDNIQTLNIDQECMREINREDVRMAVKMMKSRKVSGVGIVTL